MLEEKSIIVSFTNRYFNNKSGNIRVGIKMAHRPGNID